MISVYNIIFIHYSPAALVKNHAHYDRSAKFCMNILHIIIKNIGYGIELTDSIKLQFGPNSKWPPHV